MTLKEPFEKWARCRRGRDGYQLHAVRAAAMVAVADQPQVAGVVGGFRGRSLIVVYCPVCGGEPDGGASQVTPQSSCRDVAVAVYRGRRHCRPAPSNLMLAGVNRWAGADVAAGLLAGEGPVQLVDSCQPCRRLAARPRVPTWSGWRGSAGKRDTRCIGPRRCAARRSHSRCRHRGQRPAPAMKSKSTVVSMRARRSTFVAEALQRAVVSGPPGRVPLSLSGVSSTDSTLQRNRRDHLGTWRPTWRLAMRL